MELKVVKRKNAKGKVMIAPFINGWNVWDIPVKEWTPAVQAAILNAYKIGIDQHRGLLDEMAGTVTPKIFERNKDWPEL
jgi:methionine aminopeptidase